MKIRELELAGVKLIDCDVFSDNRGFFLERFNREKFAALGLPVDFVQDNHSRSRPGVLRGLHYQRDPWQGKLVGVVSGRILDVVVDIRKDSRTCGRYVTVELDSEQGQFLWVPGGFAHGFCVLGDEPADVLYKVDGLYNSKKEGGIIWNDPDLKIAWPNQDFIISGRDWELPTFQKYLKI